MKFSPLRKHGSIKRIGEPHLLESRPCKKSSLAPGDTSGTQTGLRSFKDVFNKCIIHRNRERERERHHKRRSLRAADERNCDNELFPQTDYKIGSKHSGLITPTLTPVKVGKASNSQRIQSAAQLEISSPITPLKENAQTLSENFADLSLLQPLSSPYSVCEPLFLHNHQNSGKPHQIFEIPEILENIVRFVSSEQEIPREKSYTRRKPLSYEHALLIYKDERKANEVWKEANDATVSIHGKENDHSILYNCLMVNKLWYSVSLSLLLENIYFKSPAHLNTFIKYSTSLLEKSNKIAHPSIFVLHKFHSLKQNELDQLSILLSGDKMKWLEFYICPNVIPPLPWISKFKSLERLILPGNKALNDDFLLEISPHVSNLKKLDLRACDNITDSGIVAIAIKCPKLEICNLGRHRNGGNITSVSVLALAKHTQIETLGIAGCKVNDAGLWELAQLRGSSIRRLSLNNCDLLTNHSIPILFAFNYFPNLAVLEIRNIQQITDVRHLVHFKLCKRAQNIPVLIEGCERITKLLSEEETRLNAANSLIALQDMSHWVNASERRPRQFYD